MIDIDALKRDKRPQSSTLVHALLDRLEAAEKELAELRSSMKFRTSLIGRTEAERDALRAALQHETDCVEAAKAKIEALRSKIKRMERQEPVGEIQRANSTGNYNNYVVWVPMVVGSKLYALPGAQPAPSVPDAWKLVPIEPTEKMINEGTCASTLPGPRYIDSACAKQCWTNMLAAAPEAKP